MNPPELKLWIKIYAISRKNACSSDDCKEYADLAVINLRKSQMKFENDDE